MKIYFHLQYGYCFVFCLLLNVSRIQRSKQRNSTTCSRSSGQLLLRAFLRCPRSQGRGTQSLVSGPFWRGGKEGSTQSLVPCPFCWRGAPRGTPGQDGVPPLDRIGILPHLQLHRKRTIVRHEWLPLAFTQEDLLVV